VEEILEL